MNTPGNIFTVYEAQGLDVVRTVEDAQALTKALMAQPGYFDTKHPDHGRLVADARWLYDATTSEGDA